MSTPDSSASRRTATTAHEQRECRSCNGFGLVLLDAEYDFETGELAQETIGVPSLPRQRQRVGLSVRCTQAARVIDVYTSHWRSPLLADVDAQIISISRGAPRWRLPFPYRRMRELAPNDRTWATKDEQEYEASYAQQLEEIGAEAILERLEMVAGGLPAVLLCWEKPGEWCHRRMLADFLRERAGLVVPELRPGDAAPTRPDAAAPAAVRTLRRGDVHDEERKSALYARVSYDERARGSDSTGGQLRRLRDWAAGEGWEVVGEYVDEDWSGKQLARPSLNGLRERVQEGDVAFVLTARRDRLVRSGYRRRYSMGSLLCTGPRPGR